MPKTLYSLKSIKTLLKKERPSKICIVTSRTLSQKLKWAVKEIPHTHIIFLPNGESAKEWKQVEGLLQQFNQIGLDRKSIVLALGGGTIGDAAGFAASIYLRGIRYIQVPTTLLAQVDSAHGGKTGINFQGCKNQVGSFYGPLAIMIDSRFLHTLSKEQLIDGLGEIIKAGLIKDPSILSLLRKEKITTLTKSVRLSALVRKSIAVKQFYIRKDPNEHTVRQILNAGHTIGHAVELKYKLPHGKAVLIGLLRELSIGESLRITPRSVRIDLETLLDRLDVHIQPNLGVDLKSLAHDKKVSNGKIMFPVIAKEGKVKLISLELSALRNHL